MRLPCDVVVVSRLLPSAGMRAPGRAARALLALGKPTGGDGGVCLLVSTARHRPGAKYQVSNRGEGRGWVGVPCSFPRSWVLHA